MELARILDVFEALLRASEHPDIVEIKRYGTDRSPGGASPAGVKVRYESGSEAYLWGAVWPGERPISIPEELPPPKRRAERMAIFAVQLLDAARPDVFRGWQLVAFPDLGLPRGETPAGVSLACTDGTKTLLRVTAGSSGLDPAEDPYPDYRIPEGVKEWHLRVNAASVAPG